MRRVLGALLPVLAACSSDGASPTNRPPPVQPGSCAAYVFALPEGSPRSVAALGSWNDWALPATPLQPHPTSPGWWVLPLSLRPGEYGYLLQEDGASKLDLRNPLTTFRGNDEVSLLTVDDCHAPAITVASAKGDQAGAVRLVGSFRAAEGGGGLATVEASSEGGALRVVRQGPDSFELEGNGFARGRHAVTVVGRDAQGREARARAGVWVQPRAASWDEGLLYQVVVDRFRGPGGAALGPPPTPGSRAGGTLDGVRAELEAGFFDSLGVTALWLSPVYLNPDEARVGRDGRMYEGYHGYWPLGSRSVDPKIGGQEALRALIDAAHRRGVRVLLDVVPNHVYETNPLYLERRGQGWFQETNPCVCGAPGCDWSTHILSCWFTPYLPDVRWQNAEAARTQVDDVRWWVDTFGVDGVRVDAVPMMPRAATRRLVRGLRRDAAADEPPFALGEVFTGPGLGGIDQIKYFLGPDALSSAFDFPLMWALRDAVASDRAGLDEVEAVLAATDQALDGSGAVKARIVGNHDVTRFLSAAAGDDGGDPWTAPPPRPADPRAFARHRMGMALMLTLPGMPVIYYGDELGLAGASDPDCRRVLPSFEGLPAEEASTLKLVRALGSLRSCSAALRRGARRPLLVSRDGYAFAREVEGEQVVVAVAKGTEPITVALPPGVFRDVLTEGQPEVSSSVTLQPLTARVLIQASSPCR